LPAVDRKNQRPGLIMAAIYRTLLDEIKHENFQVLHQRISLTPRRAKSGSPEDLGIRVIRMKVAVIGGGWAGIAAAVTN
jgi:hypothetical protein